MWGYVVLAHDTSQELEPDSSGIQRFVQAVTGLTQVDKPTEVEFGYRGCSLLKGAQSTLHPRRMIPRSTHLEATRPLDAYCMNTLLSSVTRHDLNRT